MARPAFAQVRPFFLFTEERFAASNTFNATFGTSVEPTFGGGVDVVMHRFFVDVAVSRMSKTGQRFFVDSTGTAFGLGIPSHVTLTPVELSAGYRRPIGRIIPYGSVGVGWYRYSQVDDFSAAGENVATTHSGVLANGGIEVRLSKWWSVAGDAQYTHVSGILGQSSLTSGSQAFGEDDLGGVAARVRVLFGR